MKSLVSGAEVLPAYSVSIDIEKTVCITGHRTSKIVPYKNNPAHSNITYSAIKLMLYKYIDMAIEAGYENFISGLARGTDLWSAEYVLMKKRRNDHIKLIAVMPFLRHAEFMSENEIVTLADVERKADYLLVVNTNPDIVYGKNSSVGSSKNLYRDRNYYMVDHSSAVIAFMDNELKHSGTFQTISYAYKNGRKVCSFSINEIYNLIEKSDFNIRTIGYEIAHSENVFRT